MQKKAIILLATLGIIITIIALIGQSLKLLDSSIEDSKQFQTYNQSGILKNDLQKILQNVLKDIKNNSDFEKITYLPLIFEDDEQNVKIEITIKPNSTIDINSIKQPSTLKDSFIEVLKKYKIKDEELFMVLLSDRSEISENDKRFDKNYFYSLEQWMFFVEYYASRAEDGEVLKIPWGEIVGFDDIKKIDTTALEGNLALDGIEFKPADKMSYEKEANYQFVCEVTYNYGVVKDSFRFIYQKQI